MRTIASTLPSAPIGIDSEVAPRSLRRNFSWIFAGNAFYAACQWVMLALLAKLGSAAMVGQFALALAITSPVIMLANLQLASVQATDATRDYAFADYLAVRLLTTAAAVLVIIGVAIGGSHRGHTMLVILVVGLGKGLDAISDIYYGLFQQREHMDRMAKAYVLNGLLSMIGLGLALHVTGDVVWAVGGSTLASAAVLMCYCIPAGAALERAEPCSPERQELSTALRRRLRLSCVALPLGIVMLLVSLNTSIPRYLIARGLGERDLGIFAALASLTVAGTAVVDALGRTATPRLARYYAAGHIVAFRSLLLKLLALGAALACVGIVLALTVGPLALRLLYTPEYAAYRKLLVLLTMAAGIGFIASFLGYAMTAARHFKIQAPLFGGVMVVTFVASALLIPPFGTTGAAAAMVIAVIVQLIGSAGIIGHALRQRGGEA